MEPTKLQNEELQEQTKNVSPHHPGPGMRRDNESIDDFEHLEPESSPVKEFHGHGTQAKTNKPEVSSDVGNGASFEHQKPSDISVHSYKLEPTVENKNMEHVGDGNFALSSTPDTLLDSEVSLFGKNDFQSTEIPEKSAFPEHPEDALLGLSSKSTLQSDLESKVKEGKNLQFEPEFNIQTSIGNQKDLAKAFMDTEREEASSEGPNSHGDMIDKFSTDTDFLKTEKKEENEPELDTHNTSSDVASIDPPTFVGQDKDKQFDSFLDSDEHSKPEFKLKGKLPEEFGSSKSSLSAQDDDDEYGTDSHASQDEKLGKKSEPEFKPAPVVSEPEHKVSPNVPEPVKPLLSVSEPSIKPDNLPTKSIPEKPSAKSVPPEGSAKSGAADSVLDEIKPIQLFQCMGLDAWFKPDRLHPKVVELVYWRDPKKSGIVFGSVLGVLLSLSYFSLISVVAYLSLGLLTGTISFRIYKNVLQAVQKTSDGHPFKEILELDLTLPQDKVREVTDIAVAHVNAAALELRRLFLVEDLVDSIKFGVLLWCLTYVGAWFNGMTLIIIAFVALFTLPKVYENNKAQIDQNLDVVRSKVADITSKVKAAIPIGKKPAAEEEKKEQ